MDGTKKVGQLRPIRPSIIIGIVTGSLSLLGMHLGHRLGQRLGKYMNFTGGILLLAIGVRIVLAHL